MIKKIKKGYIYTRVSTATQVDGYSLDAQKDKLRKYAEYQDYTIAGEYSDEGFSGKNIQGRIEFRRMLQAGFRQRSQRLMYAPHITHLGQIPEQAHMASD